MQKKKKKNDAIDLCVSHSPIGPVDEYIVR